MAFAPRSVSPQAAHCVALRGFSVLQFGHCMIVLPDGPNFSSKGCRQMSSDHQHTITVPPLQWRQGEIHLSIDAHHALHG